MIALIQRVSKAEVVVDGATIASIGPGLCALIGVAKGDGPAEAARLADKLLGYRVFADAAGRMNRSVRDVAGSVLLVPQFTLAADTQSGLRPSFSSAAAPEDAVAMFERLVEHVRASAVTAGVGRFGADMKVTLTNDGPVTFWLEVPPRAASA